MIVNAERATMINRHGNRRRQRLALLLAALALTLAGCAQLGFRPIPGGSDAYHYRQPFQAGA
jgi:hypothetical protein